MAQMREFTTGTDNPKAFNRAFESWSAPQKQEKEKRKKDMESWEEEKQKCLQFMPPNQFSVNTVSGMGTGLFNKGCYDL